MYIYLSSNDSKSIYHDNTATNFRSRLARPLSLRGDYEIAIIDLTFPEFNTNYNPSHITLKSSICEDSCADDTLAPILLRVFKINNRLVDIAEPRYIRLNTQSLCTIDIHLSDAQGLRPSFKRGEVCCTLHIRRCQE